MNIGTCLTELENCNLSNAMSNNRKRQKVDLFKKKLNNDSFIYEDPTPTKKPKDKGERFYKTKSFLKIAIYFFFFF